jgi:uncharacterized protein YbcI
MASGYESVQSEETAYSGTTLAAVSDGLVKLHKDICGRGPTNARTFASGNAVVCLLHRGLTRAEQTLLDDGRVESVIRQRESLYRVMGPKAAELVGELLGRRVTAMTMAVDPANELETAVFVLDAPIDT